MSQTLEPQTILDRTFRWFLFWFNETFDWHSCQAMPLGPEKTAPEDIRFTHDSISECFAPYTKDPVLGIRMMRNYQRKQECFYLSICL